MSQPYQHRPLSSETSFRIIELHPAKNYNDPLYCDILELDIVGGKAVQHPQSYEAVSYVWGTPSRTCELRCNNGTIMITPNCESALRHLRFTGTARRRKLFVDAICIDQSSNRNSKIERNHQVKLMGEIYSRARRALIWLGAGNELTQLAFKWIRKGNTWSLFKWKFIPHF